jgi:nucleotide-binding universal stress UspA family protein
LRRRRTEVSRREGWRMKRKILVPVDLGDQSLTVLDAAKSIAGTEDELVLLHVVLDPSKFAGFHVPHQSTEGIREELMEEAIKKLDRFCRRHGGRASCLLEFGIPYKEILEVAEREKVDLIVIGKRQGTGVMEHLFVPRTSKKVLLNAKCEVKIIPLPLAVETEEELLSRPRM